GTASATSTRPATAAVRTLIIVPPIGVAPPERRRRHSCTFAMRLHGSSSPRLREPWQCESREQGEMAMPTFTRDEVESEFATYFATGPVREDWQAWVDLFVDDVTYLDHWWGRLDGK